MILRITLVFHGPASWFFNFGVSWISQGSSVCSSAPSWVSSFIVYCSTFSSWLGCSSLSTSPISCRASSIFASWITSTYVFLLELSCRYVSSGSSELWGRDGEDEFPLAWFILKNLCFSLGVINNYSAISPQALLCCCPFFGCRCDETT